MTPLATPTPTDRTPAGTLVCPIEPRDSTRPRDAARVTDGEWASDDDTAPDSLPYGLLLACAQARVGATLGGKYRLDRVLGIGGMAAVYAATHVRNANRVAVKLLHPGLADSPVLRAHFLREGYATNSVDHSGTVRVLDDDTTDEGLPFLVMDRLDGETVAERSARLGGRLAVREVATIVGQVLDVLSSAHRKGTVHRDIKPENVFLTTDGAVKVLDFGIAYVQGGESAPSSRCGMFGTPAYMPPERACGTTDAADARSDVWAVGALAFALISGRYVHSAKTPQELVLLAAMEPAPPLASVAPEVPPEIAGVVDRALAFDTSDRWHDARAMQQALAGACDRAFDVAPSCSSCDSP